jgi:hypothetical protein
MLKTSLLGASLILLAACASNPPTAPRNATARAENRAGSAGACVNKSDTRLPSATDLCAGAGHSFSSDALKSTGGATTADALRLLDPTVTVHP